MGRGKRKVDIHDTIPMTMRALLILSFTAVLPAAMATEYTVGDATGWDFAPTSSYYSDWASGPKFLPGDKLVFKYLPSAHNVQEVTEVNYAACNSVSPIAEYETGNDIITFPKPGTHYYICGFLGHCDQGGMKLKATVNSPKATNLSSPSPSPAKTPELSSPMTSIIPQLPGGETHPHLPHGHGHGAPNPTPAPVSTPGGHSCAAPFSVPLCLNGLLLISWGIAILFPSFGR